MKIDELAAFEPAFVLEQVGDIDPEAFELLQAYVSDPRLQALVIAGIEMRMLRLAVGVDDVILPGAVNVPRHRPSGKHKAQWKGEMNHGNGARR